MDLIDHDKLQMKRDISARSMAEEMLTLQFLVSTLAQFFHSLMLCFQLQGFLRSTLIYCYFRKVSKIENVGTSNKRLEEAEEENAKLKEAVAKMEEELRVIGQHSTAMEDEASDASMARQRAEAELDRLFEELTGLWAEHVEL